jgi:hypothetical protein
MDFSKPYTVTVPSGNVPIFIVDKDGAESAFSLMGTVAKAKVAIRIGGGCKGMSRDDKDNMLSFFSTTFSGYRGVVWSGGTRQVTDGMIDPMVTEVPGIIMEENPDCVAIGTIPRTDNLRLVEDSRLVLDGYGTAPNVSQRGLLIVQDGADGNLDWNGDVDRYIGIMDKWSKHGGFSAIGLITWNGGPVTWEEIDKVAKKKWPVILVEGTGRVTDETIAKIRDGYNGLPDYFKGEHVIIVPKDNPEILRGVLMGEGFFPE